MKDDETFGAFPPPDDEYHTTPGLVPPQDDEKTAEDMFGTEPPGKPVKHRAPSHLQGYKPRGHWIRRGDLKWVRLPQSVEERYPETQDNTRKD